MHEDFISNLSRISQLTGKYLSGDHYDKLMVNRLLGPYIC
jgi:hypothetical protein